MPEQARVSIVHGDYRLDNMIFHATEPRVQAVLDWELSTLGDPMADFTYLLMQWTMPGLANADLKALNIPSLEEAAQIYCNVTGMAVPDLNWYFSYNLFRLAGITQGIAGRVRDGTAANAKAHGVRQAHRAAVEGVLGIRAEGRRDLHAVGKARSAPAHHLIVASRWARPLCARCRVPGIAALSQYARKPVHGRGHGGFTMNDTITKAVSSEMNFGQVMLVRGCSRLC